MKTFNHIQKHFTPTFAQNLPIGDNVQTAFSFKLSIFVIILFVDLGLGTMSSLL